MVVTEKHIFAGVWDGHYGHYCSEYAEEQVFANLKKIADDPEQKGSLASQEMLWDTAYRATDNEYLRTTKAAVRAKQKRAFSLFAGTCAVGGLLDLDTNQVSCANLGERRDREPCSGSSLVAIWQPWSLLKNEDDLLTMSSVCMSCLCRGQPGGGRVDGADRAADRANEP